MVSSFSDPVIQKKNEKRCMGIACRTHARVRSLHLIVARRILKLWVFGEKGSMITDTLSVSARARGCVHVFAFLS